MEWASPIAYQNLIFISCMQVEELEVSPKGNRAIKYYLYFGTFIINSWLIITLCFVANIESCVAK